MYIIHNGVCKLPNKLIRIPKTPVWIDCPRLVMGKSLSEKALECSFTFGTIFTFLPLVKNCFKDNDKLALWLIYIPSRVVVGAGIYIIHPVLH